MPLRVGVTVEPAQFLLRMKNGERRLVYVVVNTINNTLKRAQQDVRAQASADFTIRSDKTRKFIMQEIAVISPFANVKQGRPYGEIGVGSVKKPKKRLLLPMYEEGGERLPFTPGAKSVAVPVIGGPARPTFGVQIPKALQIGQLRLTLGRKRVAAQGEGRVRQVQKRRSVSKSSRIRYGLQDTYQIPSVGVFQRKPGATSGTLMYAFVKDQKLPKRMSWMDTVTKSIDKWWGEELYQETLRTVLFQMNRR